ncbi:hypothetical protein EMIHUDRAFT_209710 [Emiliania huxleyi CCMP1516]|uniref:Methyltransferase domain-containing protein n=2 Tax=Emiliania huxleyi TaxID=2903 RepID=A0A0D3J2L8_EMIH1|nr:hypothetical protein EMIHUDRAFT_209710 [Emiliania huxleyi CCMP1516]EOD17753.1 hypothetical protein EMIHUDRAFT_209710 [Emiliania huxleyi CCMP1516]|eukprot:XP_005770182.1 hypothetical protein EMIHUDRAFT_209710 [Emiliania huxleyi CCMP1516]
MPARLPIHRSCAWGLHDAYAVNVLLDYRLSDMARALSRKLSSHSFPRCDGAAIAVLLRPSAEDGGDSWRGEGRMQSERRAIHSPFADDTGSTLWASAAALCAHLASLDPAALPAGPRVELGTGLGLCGIALAKLDAARGVREPLVCTDGSDDALRACRDNIALNDIRAETERLEWGNVRQAEALLRRLGRRPGLIIGSDLTYSLDSIPPLVQTVAALGATATLLAFPPRIGAGSLAVRDGFRCEEHARLARLAKQAGLVVRQAGPSLSTHVNGEEVVLLSLERGD